MFIIYDILFILITLFFVPIYLFKGKFHKGFFLRLGILPDVLKLDNPIWVHAVSVGEAVAVKGLIEGLRIVYPHKKFVISTVTPTGNKIAKTIAREGDFVTYLPLDLSMIVKNVLGRIKPSLFIIAETEVWPNLILRLSKMKIPIAVVNGRISDNSFKGYQAVRPLVNRILNKISVFCVQTDRDKERLIALGVVGDKIQVTGNMKFDAAGISVAGSVSQSYRQKLRVCQDEKLFVAGSTHLGEETIILEVYKTLLKDFPALRLLIAPRHPERADEIIKLADRYKLAAFKISQLNNVAAHLKTDTIFILDSIGQLVNYYSIADIVFVGGSLIKKGGHNIIEPAALAKPVITGPYMFNFKDIFELFLDNEACIVVRDKKQLEESVRVLLKAPNTIFQYASGAARLIQDNKGSTKDNLLIIERLVSAKAS